MRIYIVMQIVKERTLKIESENMKITKDIPLVWAPGMMGAIPVFTNKEDAEAVAGDKYIVMEFDTI